jgi:hypothetical protein
LLALATRIPLVEKIGADMTRFLTALAPDNSIDRKPRNLRSVAALMARIAQAHELALSCRGAAVV